MITVLLRGRAQRLQIRSGAGFGHRNRGHDFARNHFGEPMRFLLFRSVSDQIVCHDIRLERKAGRGVAAIAEFLIDHGIVAEVEAKAAVSFRHRGAEQAKFAGFGPD